MTRILLALDGSPQAEQALFPVLGLLRDDDELTMLRIAVEPDEAQVAVAESYLRELVVRLRDNGVEAALRILVRVGNPFDEIVEAARLYADQLVLCSQGRTGLARWVLGSVAESVVRVAPCPTWLIRAQTPAEPFGPGWRNEPLQVGRILLPLDGSERDERTLVFLLRWPPAAQATLILLAAVEAPLPLGSPAASMTAYLESRGRDLESRGWTVERQVCDQRAATAILEVAESRQADLVVMSTHGLTGLQRWLEGSVSESVARRSGCPLLLLPPTPREGDAAAS